MPENEDPDLEDFMSKEMLIDYIEHEDEDITANAVLGRFLLPPSLEEDVQLLIDLIHK